MSEPTHVTLSAFLAPLTAAVKSVSASTWVAAEVAEIRDPHHVYITLIETDASGAKVAELRASLWATGKQKLLLRFAEGAGGEKLRKGLKILVKLRATLHPLYGLTATIEDIDPSFTLGDAARKLNELRQRLITEGIYDRQRALAQPVDFTSIAVISPAGAAGEGDFRSHADPLEAAGLCRFHYFTATFQGERTSAEIVAALRAVYSAHRITPFDALIVLRGGGAQSDLAWLNDYLIANAISRMPMPVLVAIGHERDTTILDEIANLSFHTPSKAIGHITTCIFDNARAALEAAVTIFTLAARTHDGVTQAIERAREAIHSGSGHQLRIAVDTLAKNQQSIAARTQHAIEIARAGLQGTRLALAEASHRKIEQAAREIDIGIDEVVAEADRGVMAIEHQMDRCRQIILGAATQGVALAQNDIAGRRLLIRDRAILGHRIMAEGVSHVAHRINAAARSGIDAVDTTLQGQRGLIRDRGYLGHRVISTGIESVAERIVDHARSAITAMETDIEGRCALLRDRSILGVSSTHAIVQSDAGYVRGAAAKDIALMEADVEGRRNLLRDRAFLGQQALAETVILTGRQIHRQAAQEVAVVEADIDGRHGLLRDRSYLAVRNLGDRIMASAEYVLGLGPEKTLERGFVMARHLDGRPATRKAQLGGREKIVLQFADGQIGAVTDDVE